MTASDLIALIALLLTPAWAAFGAWFGTRLQRQSFIEQIHYSKFHEHRAEVLEELYRLVVESRRAFPLNTPMGASEKVNEQGYKFIDASANLKRFYDEKALWLDDDIRQPLDRFLDETEELAVRFGRLSFSPPMVEFGKLEPGDLQEMAEKDSEAAAEFYVRVDEVFKERGVIAKELEAIRVAVETEFRKTLKGERGEDTEKGRRLFGG